VFAVQIADSPGSGSRGIRVRAHVPDLEVRVDGRAKRLSLSIWPCSYFFSLPSRVRTSVCPECVSANSLQATTPLSSIPPQTSSPSTTSITLIASSTSSVIPETSPTAQVSHTLLISLPVLRASLQPSPSSASASTLPFLHTVSSQPAPDATSSARPSSTNSAVGGASGGIIVGGILAAVVCIAGIVFALLYFLVRSIYTLFRNTMSYHIIRGSLAVTRMKQYLKKFGLALKPVDSPSSFRMNRVRSDLIMLWVLALPDLRP
jgi:hypothetical protein